MTAQTPIYGLEYLTVGEPARNTRAALENNAFTIEAALQLGGVAAPGASDLLAVSGRVSVLEADKAAEDAFEAPQAITFASGFAQYTTSPYGEAVRCWKSSPTEVRVSGLVAVTSPTTSGSTTSMFTLPVGYRPAVQLLRDTYFQTGSSAAPIYYRLNVTTAGVVQVFSHAAIAGGWLTLDFGFRTVNT